MDRVVRLSPRRGRLLWAAAAAGAVAAVALALKVAGVADSVEFVATLLVAPVVVAALLGDRNLGYVAAGVAAVAYLALRFDDIEQVGALGVVALVVFRAGSYGFVAYLTPQVYARLTGDEVRPAVAPRHLRVDVLDPDASQFADPAGEADDAYWAAGAPPAAPGHDWDAAALGPPAPAWEAASDEPPATGARPWQEPSVPADSPFARAWQDEPDPDPVAETYAPVHPEPRPPVRDELPPAPRVPTGWIDDATSPLGDETIPVGYTGELFLGKELGLLDPHARPAAATPHPAAPVNGSVNGGAHIVRGGVPTNGHDVHDVHDGDRYAGAHVRRHPAPPEPPPMEPITLRDPSAGVDAETRLWNAQYFRDRLTSEIESSRRRNEAFSVVMIQVADEPFQALPYRRQVALLRELGHQFVPRFFDHLVHLPDGAQHWFAVVLAGTDRTTAHAHEDRLRTTIAAYLRSRGLRVGEVQSASLTSPDDDEAMAAVWSSLLGADPHGVGA